MASVWKDNKILKKWYKKRCLDFFDGNFNFNLTDLMSDPLLDAISKDIGVNKEYIYLGAGISQFIGVILSMDCWKNIYIPSIEFGLYLRQGEKLDKKLIKVPSSSLEEILTNLKKYKTSENDLLCLSSPRWFDGEMLSKEQLNMLLESFKGTIVIDEAYVDYSSNEKGLLNECLNNERIILLRSFSKKYFAAGLRVGYLVTTKSIEGLRNTLIPPHSISTFSANLSISLLNDKDVVELFSNTRNYVRKNRDTLYEYLKNNARFEARESQANFLTLQFSSRDELEKTFNDLKGLPGIQKFEIDNTLFLKIWISDARFSNVVLTRING